MGLPKWLEPKSTATLLAVRPAPLTPNWFVVLMNVISGLPVVPALLEKTPDQLCVESCTSQASIVQSPSSGLPPGMELNPLPLMTEPEAVCSPLKFAARSPSSTRPGTAPAKFS